MGIYLDQLRSTLKDVQSKHITNLLKKQKDSGEIKNIEDFRARLSELTAQILSDQVAPSLQLFFGNLNQVIDSETYNFMLDRIRDDLEAVYSELNTLDEIVAGHNNLINNVVLKAIKYGMNELENKITFYEFLAANPHGFTKSLFNTFTGASNSRTYRTDKGAGILFNDPRTSETIGNDVTIDTVGERILLGADNLSYVHIKAISQIFDSEATQSEEVVSFDSLDINNVIDGAKGTYWTYSVLQKQINPEGVIAKFEVDLGVNQEVNFIDIESAAIFPMNIIQIEYLDPNNTYQEINIHEPLLNRTNRINFAKINASKINIVIEQLNALEVQYENKVISDNYDSVISKGNPIFSTDKVAKEIRESITSSKLLENAFMISQSAVPGASVKYYDYTFGFDNIKVGNAQYADTSIFVSSPITIDNLTQIGLKSKELRPLTNGGVTTFTSSTYPATDVGYFLGSIEYYVVMQNYNENDKLIDINKIPLLPTGISYINHEALVLAYKVGVSNVPNTGVLRFYTLHFNEDQLDELKVYRNGTLLTISTDYIIEAFPYTNDFVPPNGQKNSVGIRIMNPSSTDFYTVSYAPLQSNTRVAGSLLSDMDIEFDNDGGIKIVDLIGDASATINADSVTHILSNKHAGQNVAYTKLNLVIILRKNSPDSNVSPGVDEYTLLLHNKN